MKNIAIFLCLFFAYSTLTAQSYQTAVGVRINTNNQSGNTFGISAQQRIGKFSTLEAIFIPSIRTEENSVDLLYEHLSLIHI